MNTTVKVEIGGKLYEYPMNVSLLEISRDFQRSMSTRLSWHLSITIAGAV